MRRHAGNLAVGIAVLAMCVGLAACGGQEGGTTGSNTSTTPVSTSQPPVPPTETPLSTTSTSTTTSSSTTTTTTTLAPVGVEWGDEGDSVLRLQTALADARFFREEIDGVFGPRTAAAVMAYHKFQDLERTSAWQPEDWDGIESLSDVTFSDFGLPERAEADRIELDLTRQLAFVVFESEVVAIIPISSGNGEYYRNSVGNSVRAVTPRGDFKIYKHYEGWRISYLGGLYRPWYFRGGYAIHGSNSVPAYPASHGCVRVPNWEADWLAGELWIGLEVHVWD